jgi:hypothetical protein
VIACADSCVKLGNFFAARMMLAQIGETLTPEQLVIAGTKCLEEGFLDYARKAFVEAGHAPGIIAVGESYLAKDRLYDAYSAFVEAKHRHGLLACGKRWLKEGDEDSARNAFAQAVDLESVAS